MNQRFMFVMKSIIYVFSYLNRINLKNLENVGIDVAYMKTWNTLHCEVIFSSNHFRRHYKCGPASRSFSSNIFKRRHVPVGRPLIRNELHPNDSARPWSLVISRRIKTFWNLTAVNCGHRPALTSVQSHRSLVYENRSNSRLLTTNPTQASFWYRSWQQWSFLIGFHPLAIICDSKLISQLPSEKSCLLATLSVSVCPALLRLIEVMWTTASLKLAMCHTKFGSGYISPIFGARARVDG